MPSTYTNNLGIEKPGDGEQDGVWGDVINYNSDIIDRASNGTLFLTLTGTSSTLATSDGSLSNGQYKLLVLQGTPSGTHTITVSPNTAQKIYYVRNTTAQSVIFTQGSGGNITLAAGDSGIIYTNGVGTGSAVSSFTDHLAMSNPSITGGTITGITDLAVADGGTGASTGAGAIANFGITASVAELNTLDNVNTAGNFGLVPSGGIIIWSGSAGAIPTGWLLCNGASGTPDLRDRFVVGAGSTYAVNATGGAATVTLATINLPAHTHGVSITSGGESQGHVHGGSTGTTSGLTGSIYGISEGFWSQGACDGVFTKYSDRNVFSPTNGDQSQGGRAYFDGNNHSHGFTTNGNNVGHTHLVSGNTGSIGSGTAHENLPPYYALCYIMKS